MNTYEQHPTTKLTTIIISLVVVAGLVVLLDHFKIMPTTKTPTSPVSSTDHTTSTVAPSNSSDTTSNTPAATSTSGYKDGTYTASSIYYVPHGSESIQVSLTLQNGVVSDASIQNSESNNDSAQYQEEFAANYRTYVVGQKISGLQLDTVAGAPDTTQGFNSALSRIIAQAHA